MSESEESFQFPQSLLKQISECSMGFLLFTIDQDGKIVPFVDFPNEMTAKALNAYSQDFSKAFTEVEVENLVNFLSSFDDTDPEEFEEED